MVDWALKKTIIYLDVAGAMNQYKTTHYVLKLRKKWLLVLLIYNITYTSHAWELIRKKNSEIKPSRKILFQNFRNIPFILAET